jgi:hypothetical protein
MAETFRSPEVTGPINRLGCRLISLSIVASALLQNPVAIKVYLICRKNQATNKYVVI